MSLENEREEGRAGAPEGGSPLESLRARVYRQGGDEGFNVSAYSDKETAEPYGWEAPPKAAPKKRLPWTIKFLIATAAFLVLAGLVAAFLIFRGTRGISSDRVSIREEAPVSIASGDTVSIVVTIHNGNPATLSDATLLASLPSGTRTADGTGAPFTQYSDVLGTVPAGADVTRTIQAKLFGTEGQALEIPMRVEYHTEGSNALFVSEGSATITVATSPLSIDVQSLSQVPSGQLFTVTATVRSNAATTLQDVALSAAYPSGFSVRSTVPTPSSTNFFMLGTMAPGEQKTVKITGTLIGQEADQRVFRFRVGNANPDGTGTLGNSFAEGSSAVAITRPFLNVDLSLDRESGDTVIVKPGENVSALLSWKNTLAGSLTGARIRIGISGSALAAGSISGGTGFYQSGDSSVIFDRTTNSALASLASGDSGNESFSFAVKPASALSGVKNPTVTLSVSVSGQQSSQGSTPQALSSTLTRTVKVGTEVSVDSSLAHAGTGPIPPSAGTPTIYAVTLSAKNTVNSVGAAKMTMTLPSYVTFADAASAGVSYDDDAHAVTWSIGDLAPGATGAAQFRISFTPSASQQGTSPVLVGEQAFTGVDRFTGAQVTARSDELTSELPGSRSSGTVQ